MVQSEQVRRKTPQRIFRRFDHYGDTLNRYDVLKVIALVTMVIDHLGYYFFPHALWLRAIGRMAFPLFLFLVGYSARWKIKADLVLYAVILLVAETLAHYPVFPVNILITIIFTRLIMMGITRMKLAAEQLGIILIVCSALMFPTMKIIDYGMLAVLFALCGYLQRKQPATLLTVVFTGCTLALAGVVEYVVFAFHAVTAGILLCVILINMYLMCSFSVNEVRQQSLPEGFRRLLQWMSRNTLPLYVLHILLFVMIARLWLYPEELKYFRWY